MASFLSVVAAKMFGTPGVIVWYGKGEVDRLCSLRSLPLQQAPLAYWKMTDVCCLVDACLEVCLHPYPDHYPYAVHTVASAVFSPPRPRELRDTGCCGGYRTCKFGTVHSLFNSLFYRAGVHLLDCTVGVTIFKAASSVVTLKWPT